MRKVKCTWLPKSKKWRVVDTKSSKRIQFEDEVMLLNASRKESKSITLTGMLVEEPSYRVFRLMETLPKVVPITRTFNVAKAVLLKGKHVRVSDLGRELYNYELIVYSDPSTIFNEDIDDYDDDYDDGNYDDEDSYV